MPYYNYNNAYFDTSSGSPVGVTDANILKQLQSGALASTQGNPFASSYSQTPQTPQTPPTNQTINSNSLYGVNQDFKPYNPSTTSQYPIGTLSALEQKVQGEFDKLQELTSSLAGKAQFTIDQKKALGISDLETTQEDLSAQLKSLINQSQGLDIQSGLVPTQVYTESKGTSATTGGLAGIISGKQAEIALKKSALASDALLISANLDATQGKIASAYKKVENAVNEKYAPINEQISILKDNLELIMKSPAYTAAQKAQAQAQLDATKQKEKEIQQQYDNEKATKDAIIELQKENQGKIDAAMLQKLNQAKSEQEVLSLAQQMGLLLGKEGAPQIIQGTNGVKLQYDPITKKWNPIPGTGDGNSYKTFTQDGILYQYQVDANGKAIGAPEKVNLPTESGYPTITVPGDLEKQPVGSVFYFNGNLLKKNGPNDYALVQP
jgi:hypothetical protein